MRVISRSDRVREMRETHRDRGKQNTQQILLGQQSVDILYVKWSAFARSHTHTQDEI